MTVREASTEPPMSDHSSRLGVAPIQYPDLRIVTMEPVVESAVHTTPPMRSAAMAPALPDSPSRTSTTEETISAVRVIPERLEWSLIGGSVLASLTVTSVLLLFHHVYGYGPRPGALPAPQASAMAAVLQSVMASAAAPWFLYGLGAVIAVLVELIGVSGLAFALGMYLPIELNTPLLGGALVAWFVGRGKADVAILRARQNRGTLIASGFIAGGALAGVVDAVVRGIAASRGLENLWWEAGFVGPGGNVAGLLVFLALCAWIWLDSRRASAEEGTGPMISM